ncbi:hypothetical protein [Paraburkholderia dilworthii]|uniref:Uncharacterized protein n=1 Tax=Paraburkholderia dilworthii TaxID=948106 RepID=A0ABW9DD52_9BURK
MTNDAPFRVQRMGDRHSHGAAFAIESKVPKTQFFVKVGPCSHTEAVVLSYLQRYRENIALCDYLAVPAFAHDSSSQVLLVEHLNGFNYREIELYNFACEQLNFLATNVEGSKAFIPELLAIVDRGPRSSRAITQDVCLAMKRHPEWPHLCASLADHFSIELPGEGFRGIAEIVIGLCNSALARRIGVELDSIERANSISNFFLGGKNNAKKTLQRMHKQLAFYRVFANYFRIYDAHKENLIISQYVDRSDAVLMDFECAGGGTSSAMMPKTLTVLADAASQAGHAADCLNICNRAVMSHEQELYSNQSFCEQTELLTRELFEPSSFLRKRIIYAGTSFYSAIVKNLREALFLSIVLPTLRRYMRTKDFDADLFGCSEMIGQYQMWKRYYRGLIATPPGTPKKIEGEILELIDFIRDHPDRKPANYLSLRVANKISRIQTFDLSDPSDYALVAKITRPLAKIPCRLFFPDLPDDMAERYITSRLTKTKPPGPKLFVRHMDETFDAVLNFSIPYHTLPINWPSTVSAKIIEDALELWGEELSLSERELRAKLVHNFVNASWLSDT